MSCHFSDLNRDRNLENYPYDSKPKHEYPFLKFPLGFHCSAPQSPIPIIKARFLSRPLIIRVPFFLLFGSNTGSLKQKGQKGTTQEPRRSVSCSNPKHKTAAQTPACVPASTCFCNEPPTVGFRLWGFRRGLWVGDLGFRI